MIDVWNQCRKTTPSTLFDSRLLPGLYRDHNRVDRLAITNGSCARTGHDDNGEASVVVELVWDAKEQITKRCSEQRSFTELNFVPKIECGVDNDGVYLFLFTWASILTIFRSNWRTSKLHWNLFLIFDATCRVRQTRVLYEKQTIVFIVPGRFWHNTITLHSNWCSTNSTSVVFYGPFVFWYFSPDIFLLRCSCVLQRIKSESSTLYALQS